MRTHLILGSNRKICFPQTLPVPCNALHAIYAKSSHVKFRLLDDKLERSSEASAGIQPQLKTLRSASRLIGHIPRPHSFVHSKYASISAYMRDVLHWFSVSQHSLGLYRVSALVWRSVTGCAPSYLTDLCRLVSDLASRRALRSSAVAW